jgi:hypothetical protein
MYVRNVGAVGSNPITSTNEESRYINSPKDFRTWYCFANVMRNRRLQPDCNHFN